MKDKIKGNGYCCCDYSYASRLLSAIRGTLGRKTILVCPISTMWTCLPQQPSFPVSDAGQPFWLVCYTLKNVLSISREVTAKRGWPEVQLCSSLLWDLRRLPHFQVLGQYLAIAQVHWLHSMYICHVCMTSWPFWGLSNIWCFLVLWLYMAIAQ